MKEVKRVGRCGVQTGSRRGKDFPTDVKPKLVAGGTMARDRDEVEQPRGGSDVRGR